MVPALGHIKKSLVYHPCPRLNSRPHRYFSLFFICLIAHENEIYGFVSVVVMNYKSKTRFARFLGVSSEHMFLLGF